MTTPEEMVGMVQGADLRLKDMFRAASTYQLAGDFIKMHRIRGAETETPHPNGRGVFRTRISKKSSYQRTTFQPAT
jgi:hypothetical protein